MDRRIFLRNSSLLGFGLTVAVNQSCISGSVTKKTEEYELTSNPVDFILNEATIDELQQKMKSGEYTSRLIVELYLKRIDKVDKKGPKLNTIIELNPDALAIADAMDDERKAGKVRGPLHGIPVLIKDNIDTADKMMTTAGSLALVGNFAKMDAYIVKLLREAGAVLLGKTNLSEWANFRSTRSTSGWSSRGGQTRNPYLPDRSPCGSSSGSGVAVAANLCTIAIGTETNGSIACPSSVNGIVGIKPTVGLWSRTGIIPISATQDTAGPMARTVKDAAILLGLLSGIDPEDKVTELSMGKSRKDYTQFLDINGLQGKRIGVEKSFLKVHEGVDALLKKSLDIIKGKGATIIEVELVKQLKDLDDAEFDVLKFEFKDGINRYLAGADVTKVKSLKDLIAFNKQYEERIMPYFRQEILESSEGKAGLDSREYKDLLDKLLQTTRGAIDKLMNDNKLDAICGPANGPPWCIDLINGDAFTGYGAYSPAAIAGYPSITVPMGMVYDLPIGLSFFGRAFSEPELIKIAFAFEQNSKCRVIPKYLKSSIR